MAANPDFFAQKTPVELGFFLKNPSFYEPDLVAAARRELRRRGLVPTDDAAPAATAAPLLLPEAELPATRRRPWRGLLAGALLLGGGWFWAAHRAPALSPAGAVSPVRKGPPRLESVATNALPSFDVAGAVARQLATVPAPERARLAAQPRRQYRELCRRFWAAETMSEYLTDRARAGRSNLMLAEQAILAREAWEQWNKAAVYSYRFGPIMAQHFDYMGQIASHQQHILADLPELVATHALTTTPEILSRDNEAQDLLSALLPTSPVSGKPYRKMVRHLNVQL